MSTLVLTVVIITLIFLSLRERVDRKRMSKDWETIGASKSSPFSSALAGLVGTAGGIYLSLVMLFAFLEMDIPARVQIMNVELEPVAAASLLLAIIQPFFMRIIGR
ncbi:hypothetical protein JOC37_000825 [Desulfohalotomaculum tongense]|uniref:hypothetical protein n=1 Tax=Desulforadius tongensis TaxID=1216062 RepID=UPI001958CF53|nr:hypothetical protein [Desulforadius tongensis]MBM7854452.1 hypothetical protein [Desulforadius tongensis]